MATNGANLGRGRVLQVNVSAGGVPKTPVARAWVGRFGLTGDAHDEPTVHGGPHRAVCVLGIEAIERMQSEGHPLEAGSVGENLTTAGVEWSLLPPGTRARIGGNLEIEVASPAMPCSTQKGNFIDGRFSRMSIDLHPSDSRMYARVLHSGEVRAGDAITILPPNQPTHAVDELLLGRLDRAETKSSVAAWKAAAAAGFEIEWVEDGELAMCASTQIPGPAFNHASGLARLPNLLHVAQRFYDERGTTGWLSMAEEPWPGAEPSLRLDIFAAAPEGVADAQAPEGVVIREIGPDEGEMYGSVRSGSVTAGGISTEGINPWPQVYAGLARTRSRHMFVAEIGGGMVANASLHVSARTGWLRGALVEPESRGLGIQRALVTARVRAATALGCSLVGASAEPGSISARNLERLGMRRIGSRVTYPYEPGRSPRAAPA